MNTESHFLHINYGPHGVLINRNQFFASTYVTKQIAIKSKFPFINKLIPYGGNYLLSFDLNRWSRQNLEGTNKGTERIAIIVSTKMFKKHTRQAFEMMAIRGKNIFHPKLMAFIINSSSEMKTLSVSSFRMLPPLLRKKAKLRGFLAVRFPENNFADYFIDLEQIFYISFCSYLKGRYKK